MTDCTCRDCFVYPYVIKTSDEGYYCLICNASILGQSYFNIHVNSGHHNFALQTGSFVMPVELHDYYCKCCNIVITGYKNIRSHVLAEKHQCSLGSETENILLDRETIDWNSCQYFASPFVARENANEFYCLLCDQYMQRHAALEDHTNNDTHVVAVRLYGSDISPLQHIAYYCKCCDSTIYNYRNIHSHVMGQNHQTIVYDLNGQRTMAIERMINCQTVPNFCINPRYPAPGPYNYGFPYMQFTGKPINFFHNFPYGNFATPYPTNFFRRPPLSSGLPVALRAALNPLQCAPNYSRNAVLPVATKPSPKKLIEITDEAGRQLDLSNESSLPVLTKRSLLAPKKLIDIRDEAGHQLDFSNNLTAFVTPKNDTDIKDEEENQSELTSDPALPVAAERSSVTPKKSIDIKNEVEKQSKSQAYRALLETVRSRVATPAIDVNIKNEAKKQSYFCANSTSPISAKCSTVTPERYDNIEDETTEQRRLDVYSRSLSPNSQSWDLRPSAPKDFPKRTNIPPLLNVASWQFSICQKVLVNSLVKPEVDVDSRKKLSEKATNDYEKSNNYYENEQKRSSQPKVVDICNISSKESPNIYETSNNDYESHSKCNSQPEVADIYNIRCTKATNGCDKINGEIIHEKQYQQNGKPEVVDFHDTRSRAATNDCENIYIYDDKQPNRNDQPEVVDPCTISSKESMNDYEKIYIHDKKQRKHNSQPEVGDPFIVPSRESTNSNKKICIHDKNQPKHNVQPEVIPNVEENNEKTQQISSPRTDSQKMENLLDLEEDIYDMHDRLQETKRGMDLCFVTRTRRVYCLICQQMVDSILEDYYEHLCNLDHCENLDRMLRNFARTDLDRAQFSELYLAYQYMEDISETITRCLVCSKDICSKDYALEGHMDDEKHRENCVTMHAKTQRGFEEMSGRMQCDWYKVQNYWCVPCSATFDGENQFVEHLRGDEHDENIIKFVTNESALIYDFCDVCALLWYGYRSTYVKHRDTLPHKWYKRTGHYVKSELPEAAKLLLARRGKYIDGTVQYLDHDTSVKRRNKLITDLGKAVKIPFAKAYVFGSRIPDARLPDGDIDVFLSCGNVYDEKMSSTEQISCFLTRVHECLTEDPETWDVKNLATNEQLPVIKAHHKDTNFSCDISFDIGLVAGGTRFVRFLNYVFATFRKLIIFLKQWLAYCDLSGPENITSCVLYWCVIFYLQKESLLPSIARLIATADSPTIVDGSRVVPDDLIYDRASDEFTLDELLVRFFTFYANFDFRAEVACPLIGEAMNKRAFAEPKNAPSEITNISRTRDSNFFEWLNVSAMCMQDPFNIRHNIAEGVGKACLSRFRICCNESLHLLCPSVKTH